jgi:endonuclease/exonuclease/phosphatase family metal-dependent hydrolase
MIKRTYTIFIYLLACIQLFAAGNKDTKPVRMHIATYNIRLQTPVDSVERSWTSRKTDVAKMIKKNDFDIFGVQEIGNQRQEADLKALIPEYGYFGKGRDNVAGTEGEQVGIFYKTKRFVSKEKGSFFLSETPDTISKGWDAALRRMCVWTKFQDRFSKTEFYVFCTHFDHMGVQARVESAKLIVKRVKKIAGNKPVFLLGDLNTSPEATEMYKILVAAFDDSHEISKIRPSGSVGTFNGFDVSKSLLPLAERIDYIFCQKVKVFNYKVLNDKFSENAYPSDHFPVLIDCMINSPENKKQK